MRKGLLSACAGIALSWCVLDKAAGASVTATATITGAEQQMNGSWDTNEITISFNNFSETVSYGQFSTPSSIASAFAGMFARDYMANGLCARASGAVITFYLKGANATFGPMTITGSTTSFSVNNSGWTGGSGPPAPPGPPPMTSCQVTALTIDQETELAAQGRVARKEGL